MTGNGTSAAKAAKNGPATEFSLGSVFKLARSRVIWHGECTGVIAPRVGKVRKMKMNLAAALLVSPVIALAAALPPLPAPTTPDTEVSAHHAMRKIAPQSEATFEFSLSFDATPSNNVQVAFGRDADANGVLSSVESPLVIGWDCGEWFLRDSVNGVRYASTNSATAGAKTLSVSLAMNGSGRIRAASIRDGNTPIFTELSSPPSQILLDRSWDLLRLTARGLDDPSERFSVSTTLTGFSIILR